MGRRRGNATSRAGGWRIPGAARLRSHTAFHADPAREPARLTTAGASRPRVAYRDVLRDAAAMRARLCAALLVLAVAAPAAAATPQRLSRFDVNNAESWADALALCDLTAFLRTRPALDADVVVAVDPATRMDRVLYGPRFQPPSMFFDGQVRGMFERLARAGEVDSGAVGAARRRHDQSMFREFRMTSGQEMAFLEDQTELCAALAVDVASRYR